MTNLQLYLENKIRSIISNWNDDDIYAISFLVDANEAYEYAEYSNVAEFTISYNTEYDCDGADELSEKRWNYAFWRQNNVPIILAENDDEGMHTLFTWYKEIGLHNIGYEDFNHCYNDDMCYIGKGPIGYYELLSEVAAVAKKLQISGFIQSHFGKRIPIIVHDLDYCWYAFEATQIANPNGEANAFFAAMKQAGFSN